MDRTALRAAMNDSDDTDSPARRTLPPVTVVEVTAVDDETDAVARPAALWRGADENQILLSHNQRGAPFSPGERILARLSPIAEKRYRGVMIRRLAAARHHVAGLLVETNAGFALVSADGRPAHNATVARTAAAGASDGDIVLAELTGRRADRARVVEILGRRNTVTAFNRLAIREHDIPDRFSPEALTEAGDAVPAVLTDDREDLRDIPLITIDDADAHDFDDAVWAEATADGGWRLLVAIADVAHYVRPGSALDIEAQERGNSVYLPGHVVPMLPEALSNDLCSLRPGEDRACLAVDMRIDRDGRKTGHRFLRGMMRSAARTTYQEVQAAIDGAPNGPAGLAALTAPLYGAFQALRRNRAARGALEITVPEMRVQIGGGDFVRALSPRELLPSHQLIEEFMILANVAAAETLEQRRSACVYRVHEAPDPEKFAALRRDLRGFGIAVAPDQPIRPALFNQILEQADDTAFRALVHQLVLRSQSQAIYSSRNGGHFGLGLRRYAHFTSPIRRYADLLVHRALIAADGLAAGDDAPESPGDLEWFCRRASVCERRAVAAERATLARCGASVMRGRVGDAFDVTVSGVARFGLFVAMPDGAPDALLPLSALPDDFYDHDGERNVLTGQETGRRFRLGDRLTVDLTEINAVAGRLSVGFLDGGTFHKPQRRRRSRYLRRRK